MNEFCQGFHWSLFLGFELTMFHHWFRQWLGANQATSHYLNQWWLVYWCIYESLGLNELNYGDNCHDEYIYMYIIFITKTIKNDLLIGRKLLINFSMNTTYYNYHRYDLYLWQTTASFTCQLLENLLSKYLTYSNSWQDLSANIMLILMGINIISALGINTYQLCKKLTYPSTICLYSCMYAWVLLQLNLACKRIPEFHLKFHSLFLNVWLMKSHHRLK